MSTDNDPRSAADGATVTPQLPASEAIGDEPGLRWGIKSSFRDYVRGMSDGQCSVTDGAVLTPSGEFQFSPDDSSAAGGSDPSEVRFRGAVEFFGHHGFLFVSICNPWLELTAPLPVLTIESPGENGTSRIPFATFKPSDLTLSLVKANDVRLTLEGSYLFFGTYSEHEALDAFHFTNQLGIHDASGKPSRTIPPVGQETSE